MIIAEKYFNQKKGKGKSKPLMHDTLTKMTAEDIYHWIKVGYMALLQDPDGIVKTFEKCGYIDTRPSLFDDIEELSRGIEVVEMEEEEVNEGIPISDGEEAEDEDEYGWRWR